ncbi:MAG: thiamine pyrophosphate-binding protein [Thermodesulfobacteriota bacterium]
MQKDVSGAQVLARCFASQGIKFFFTVPTPRLAPLIRALEDEKEVRVITAHNETAAALMADGYIRRSRLQAAVLTDARARAISQICGVTNAWADKVPLVSLSLCENDEPDGNKSVERWRYDQRAAFQAVTSWNIRLTSLEEAPDRIAKCLRESVNNKMGPVHIDIPFRLLGQSLPESAVSSPPEMRPRPVEPLRLRAEAAAVARAAKLLMAARKPLIFCGGGVKASDACADLVRFLETYNIPIATSMAGIGSLPLSHPLCLGGPSYTSGEVFHVAVREADVVLALGAAFSGLDGFGLPPVWSGAIQFIHVDIDPRQLGLNVQPEVPVQADAGTFLKQLAAEMEKSNFHSGPRWNAWNNRLQKLKQTRLARLEKDAESKGRLMHQAKFAKELGRMKSQLPDDPVIVMDGGNTVLYMAMYAPDIDPWQILFPYGMAALGGGIPYAIGAALAAPGKPVFLVTGDGSFLYNIQELETIKRLNLPITVFVNNDSAWNMIRSMQNSFFAQNFVGTDIEGVEYARIARGFGWNAEKVTEAADILAAFEKLGREPGPGLIECITDKANTPDSLLSFALVEFEGALRYLNPLKVLQSFWLMRRLGWWRNFYQLTYIRKALLRINPMARRV